MFQHAGTVSHGTLREEDLVPAFLDVLRDLNPERAAKFESDYAEAITSLQEGLEHPYIEHMVPELEDALQEAAPEGYRFGAIEGDGADFGFWQVDSDDDDDR